MTVLVKDRNGMVIHTVPGVGDAQLVPGPCPVVVVVGEIQPPRLLGMYALGEGWSIECIHGSIV